MDAKSLEMKLTSADGFKPFVIVLGAKIQKGHNMTTTTIILIIVGIIILALLIWIIASYNKFIKLRNTVEEAFATMDVYLKKRFDLIPNLVETVKKYASHESETLTKVTEARSMVSSAKGIDEQVESENILGGTLKSLFAVSESYPDLKANENFMDLQHQLQIIETDIVNARKYYNGAVKIFNTAIEVFPSNILAPIFGFKRKPLYEVDAEEERNNVKVDFNQLSSLVKE